MKNCNWDHVSQHGVRSLKKGNEGVMKKIISTLLIFTLFFSAFPFTAFAQDNEIKIPNNAVEFNGHYYCVYDIDTIADWNTAQAYCEAQGGHLATITSVEEDTFLYSYITDAGYSSVIFGLTDQEKTDDWRWVTGEESSYRNWHPGEPNHQGGYEHYGMYYKKYTDGTWNDGGGREGVFLCEWDEYPTISLSNSQLQTSVWYDIWAADEHYKSYTKGFTLKVGDQTYETGASSYRAQADIPIDKSNQVSISKSGFITCKIPQPLVYSCNEVVLHLDSTTTPFVQFATIKRSANSRYTNLSASHFSVHENELSSCDMYIDINWNGHTPGSIYLLQEKNLQSAKNKLELKSGINNKLMLGSKLNREDGDVYLCFRDADGNSWKQKLYLDVYQQSVSSLKIDGGQKSSGTNSDSSEVDEMWGDMKLSFDMLSKNVPVSLKISPTSSNSGTIKGTLGIKFKNEDETISAFNSIKNTLNPDDSDSYVSKDSIDKVVKQFEKAGYSISSDANEFGISVSTKLLGYVEGTYELDENGNISPSNIKFSDSGFTACVGGSLSTTRQHFITPIPWYWQLELAAEMALNMSLEGDVDNDTASIEPLNSESTLDSTNSLSIEGKAAVGVSGIASVGVSGTGKAHFDGQIMPFDSSKLSLYADYEIQLFSYDVGPWVSGSVWKYKSDSYYLLKDEKWFPGSEENTKTKSRSLLKSTTDTVEWEQLTRAYLAEKSKFQANGMTSTAKATTLADAPPTDFKTNTYTFTEPQLIDLSDGKKLMVWTDDAGTTVRPIDVNRTALYYSYYNSSKWSNPAMVWDDGTADSSPVLKYVDGTAYLVWMNGKTVLSANSTYEDYCAAQEIAYARFDEQTKAFADATNITNNTQADSIPDITVINGAPTVVWTQNSAKDLMQTTGTNMIYSAKLSNRKWSMEKLAENLQMVDGLCAAVENGNLTVYASQDKDKDVLTSEDKEIYKITANGVEQMTDNDIIDVKPTMANGKLLWYSNGVLTDGTNNITLGANTDRFVSAFHDNKGVILYAEYKDDLSTTIYANYYDGTAWSEPVAVVESEYYIPKFSCSYQEDGSLAVAVDEIEMNDDSYKEANLRIYNVEKMCDLAVTDVDYTVDTLVAGDEMTVTTYLENKGTETIDSVNAVIYQGNTVLKTEDIAVDMRAGSEDLIMTTFILPDQISKDDLKVTVLPKNQADSDESDNSKTCELYTMDVSVENVSALKTTNGTIVTAYIANRGLETLNHVNIFLRQDTPDGAVLEKQTINSIPADKGVAISFQINAADGKTVYVTAEGIESEYSYANNQDLTLICPDEGIQTESIENTTPTIPTTPSNPVKPDNETCKKDSTCPISKFTDSVPTAWYHDGIHYVLDGGLMVGVSDTEFAPNATLTRAELAQILYNKAGKPEVSGLSTFSDVPATAWYAKAIAWAQQNNVVSGIGNNQFAPNQTITREQIAVMLYNEAGKPEVSGTITGFADADNVSDWAYNAVLWATKNNVVNGAVQSDGTLLLNPANGATRAETAALLKNFMETK